MKKDFAYYVDLMLSQDPFSKWMGIEQESIEEERVELKMRVRKEMCNGFDIVHGGILFSLADSALACIGNGDGKVSVAMDTHMQFLRPAYEGDLLTAVASPIKDGRRVGRYRIEIVNQDGKVLGHFTGSVFRTGKSLEPTADPHA